MSQLPFFKYNHIFSAPVRLLIKESHAIFTTIPRNESEATKTDVVVISRRYRSIVHECVENLMKDITQDRSSQIKTFQDIEVIWSLCEILLLDVNQTGALIIQLKSWIKMHFDESRHNYRDILTSLDKGNFILSDNDSSEEERYWKLFVKLVILGELKKAIQLLKCHHSFTHSDQMQLLATIIERMPLSNQYIVHEFQNKWSAWTEWCRRELETGQFDHHPSLLKVVKLFAGDPLVYAAIACDCETWYQLMVATLLYTDPCIQDTDLPDLCRRTINIFKQNHPSYITSIEEFDELDEIIMSAFEYDLIQVIARCCSYLDDNWWFVTHFVDLLHCSDQLKIHDIIDSDKLRETFLQDYASTLFDDDHLWAIGVSYLDRCTNGGIYHLECLLSREALDINDEVKAHKIISIAKKRNLNSLARSVCLLLARKWVSKSPRLTEESIRVDKYKGSRDVELPPAVNLSNALYWAVKSGDTPITTYMSDQCLFYYCKTGAFPDMSIFDSLRTIPLNNERLAFLAKYYEFKSKIQTPDLSDEDLNEAGNLIRALIGSKVFPKFICSELLKDVKELFELHPQLVYSPDKTLDLMRSVEEVTKEGKVPEDIDLRTGLIRNMARALIGPAVVDK